MELCELCFQKDFRKKVADGQSNIYPKESLALLSLKGRKVFLFQIYHNENLSR